MHRSLACLKIVDCRDYIEISYLISWDKGELNFTCFSWLLGFTSSTVIQGELRQNQIISFKEKASLVTIPTPIKTLATRGKNVANTAITSTCTTVIVSTNIQPLVQ